MRGVSLNHVTTMHYVPIGLPRRLLQRPAPALVEQRRGGSSQLQEEKPNELWENFFSDPSDNKRSTHHCDNKTFNMSLWPMNSKPPGDEHDHGCISPSSQLQQQEQSFLASLECGILYANHDDERLIRTLCQQGQLGRALDVLSRMDTALPTDIYKSLLEACYKSKVLSQAKQVHAHLTQHHTLLSGWLGDYLVVTLAKCGAIEDARQISQTLPSRTVFSWTAMISAYTSCGRAEEALRMHRCMQEDGVEPNSYTFVSLLKACGSIQDLQQGKELHADVRRKGFASDVFVGSTLVSMYGKCGAVLEAELVFNELSQRNVVSWNAMLSTYVEQGQGEKALQFYRQMQEEGVGPDQHTLLYALQACATLAEKEKALAVERRLTKWMSFEVANSLHADARKAGFVLDVFVGSTLVNMYGKCGAIVEADHVFVALSQRNVVSWTAMLSAYLEHGQGERALQLYRQMQVEGASPDGLACVTALQACCALAEKDKALVVKGRSNKLIALEIGQAVQTDTCRKDFSSDVFFGTALLSMYGKCGATVEAEHVFGALSQRNVVSWSAMLSVYVEQGQAEKALQLYMQMREEAVSPDRQTVVSGLQAVCSIAESEEAVVVEGRSTKVMSLEIGLGLHADARRKGVASDVFVSNTLVSMYGKCGAVVEAEQVFNAMAHHNVVSWTVMLSAYYEQGQGEKALQLYIQMQQEGICPDNLTSVIALQACGTLAEKEEVLVVTGRSTKVIALEIGQALHDDAGTMDYASDAFVGTALLSMYGKCGAIVEAENVFEALVERDVVSWSAMLSAYVDQSQGEKALRLYRQMQQEEVCPDQLTYMIALQACSTLVEKEEKVVAMGRLIKILSLEIGCALHADARRKGFASDLFVGNTIVNMYGKCGAVVEAEHVFGAVSHRNIVSWNAMLSAYVEQGQGERALWLYREMQNQCVTHDDVTLISLLKACSLTGSLEISNQLHFDIVSARYESIPSVAASLIHAYGSCASVVDALAFFEELSEPCLASWNACITGYAGKGNCIASQHMFERLKLAGIKPDGVTFTSAISACGHTGLVVEGLDYFALMSQFYGITPEVKHYGSMLDLLARVGDFKRVEGMLQRMPVQADQTIWLCLLGACRTHSNIELAKLAFNHAMNLQPKQAAAYVVMSNIYADAGLQEGEGDVEAWPELD